MRLRDTVADAEQKLHVLPDTLQERFILVTNATLHISHYELACRARDDYEVLRLLPGCTLAALKKRYREMAVALHPDKCLVSIPGVLAEVMPERSHAADLSDVDWPSRTCVLGCHCYDIAGIAKYALKSATYVHALLLPASHDTRDVSMCVQAANATDAFQRLMTAYQNILKFLA